MGTSISYEPAIDYWKLLVDDIKILIFLNLKISSLVNCFMVNKYFVNLCLKSSFCHLYCKKMT